MLDVVSSLSPADCIRLLVQVAILAFIFYRLYEILADNLGRQTMFLGVSYALFYAFCVLFKLSVLKYILENAFIPLLLLMLVFFHPELRRAFSSAFLRKTGFFRMGGQTTGEQIDSILNACNILVEKKRGALIIFPRHTDIKSVLDSGTRLNADLSSTLLLTIFDHDTPLHDGAAVIEAGRISYAACYLPLSEQTGIKASFGTRHRAALGLAENSDAIALVVSEETGAISLAYNANIYYDLDNSTIKSVLLDLFSYKDVLPKDVKEKESNEVES